VAAVYGKSPNISLGLASPLKLLLLNVDLVLLLLLLLDHSCLDNDVAPHPT
jgi:hypothetical protein